MRYLATVLLLLVASCGPATPPPQRSDEIIAGCNREFGAGTPAAEQCATTIMLREMNEMYEERLERARR